MFRNLKGKIQSKIAHWYYMCFLFRFKKGYAGGWFAVYESNMYPNSHMWFWNKVLRRPVACFGNYENAFYLFGPRM